MASGAAARRFTPGKGGAMALRYMGFDQRQNTRVYKFDNVAEGEPTIRMLITADLTLFQKHHIAIQEGPGLCAQKLAADLENPRNGNHELTSDDLLAHASARAAVAARQAELRRKGARRRAAFKPPRQTPWSQPR
ncbi:MAG TPA: hypothetical protein VMT32_07535 [Bryobacteraceae bacterium]|nr:hypothetical protein [Bryobacteraceae bacterium]